MRRLAMTAVPMVAIAALALTGCGPNANSSEGGANGVIKIGLSAPLTGANTAWGVAMEGGATIAAEEINDAGGVKIGDTEYTLEIVAYDDEFTPTGATSAISRMISQDGIKFVLGPTTGAATAAVQPTIQDNGVLQIHSGFGAVVSPDYDFSFRTVLTPSEYCGAWYEYLAKNRPEVKRVALVGPNDVVGQGSVGPCESAAENAGIEYESHYYERAEQDYSALVSSILASSPDAVDLTGGAPGEAAGIVKQLVQSGFTGLTMKSGGSATSTIVDIAGNEAATGHLYFEQAATSSSEAAEFLGVFDSRYTSGEKSIAILYHDSIHLLAQALEDAQSTDPAEVRDVMGAGSYQLPLFGETTWGGEKTFGIANQLLNTGVIVEWNGSEGVVIGELTGVSP